MSLIITLYVVNFSFPTTILAQKDQVFPLWNGFKKEIIKQNGKTYEVVSNEKNSVLTKKCVSGKDSSYTYMMNTGKIVVHDINSELFIVKNNKERMVDSIWISKNTDLQLYNKGLLYARFTFQSTVYGGAENPDGTSNVSSSQGPLSYRKFGLVSLDDPTAEPIEVYTDHKGYLFVWLEPGSYTLIHPNSSRENYSSGLTDVEQQEINSGWSDPGAFTLEGNALSRLEIRFSSVGYAP